MARLAFALIVIIAVFFVISDVEGRSRRKGNSLRKKRIVPKIRVKPKVQKRVVKVRKPVFKKSLVKAPKIKNPVLERPKIKIPVIEKQKVLDKLVKPIKIVKPDVEDLASKLKSSKVAGALIKKVKEMGNLNALKRMPPRQTIPWLRWLFRYLCDEYDICFGDDKPDRDRPGRQRPPRPCRPGEDPWGDDDDDDDQGGGGSGGGGGPPDRRRSSERTRRRRRQERRRSGERPPSTESTRISSRERGPGNRRRQIRLAEFRRRRDNSHDKDRGRKGRKRPKCFPMSTTMMPETFPTEVTHSSGAPEVTTSNLPVTTSYPYVVG